MSMPTGASLPCYYIWLCNPSNYQHFRGFTVFLDRTHRRAALCQNRGHAASQTGAEPWWRHQMETFSALLALCAGNSPVTGEFPSQRPVTRSFVFVDLRLDKLLSKQSSRRWFGVPSGSLWRHCNDLFRICIVLIYGCRHVFFIANRVLCKIDCE